MDFELEERKEKVRNAQRNPNTLGPNGGFKLIWGWVKQGAIDFKQYLELIDAATPTTELYEYNCPACKCTTTLKCDHCGDIILIKGRQI